MDNLKQELEKVLHNDIENCNYFISSSMNLEDIQKGGYIGGIRKCLESNLISIICQREHELLAVLPLLSEKAKRIYIEIDKQIDPSGSASIVEHMEHSASLENLYQVGYEYLKKRGLKNKLYAWKPNDITVSAAVKFVNQLDKKQRVRNISLIGLGNIGSKLTIALCECGYKVKIYSRSFYKAHNIVNGINLILPKTLIARCTIHETITTCIAETDLLISCSSTPYAIDSKFLGLLNDNSSFLDIGKRGIKNFEQFEPRASQKVEFYRLDISKELIAFHNGTASVEEEVLPKSIVIENVRYVEPGILAKPGDYLVNNINNIDQVIGQFDENLRLSKK